MQKRTSINKVAWGKSKRLAVWTEPQKERNTKKAVIADGDRPHMSVGVLRAVLWKKQGGL